MREAPGTGLQPVPTPVLTYKENQCSRHCGKHQLCLILMNPDFSSKAAFVPSCCAVPCHYDRGTRHWPALRMQSKPVQQALRQHQFCLILRSSNSPSKQRERDVQLPMNPAVMPLMFNRDRGTRHCTPSSQYTVYMGDSWGAKSLQESSDTYLEEPLLSLQRNLAGTKDRSWVVSGVTQGN